MSAKVLVVEDDHGQREALSEIVPGDAALDHTVQKALRFEASHFLPNRFGGKSTPGRWPFLRDNSPPASNLIVLSAR
jgi:hypothetical protein